MKKFMKKINQRFIYFFISSLLLEIVFTFIIFNHITLESILNVLLSSCFFAAIFSLLSGIFKDKINTIITSIILFILGVLFSVQTVFYNTFKTFFSFSILGLSDQLESFMSETINAILSNIIYILIFLLPFVLYLIFHKKLYFNSNKIKDYLLYIAIILLSGGLFIIHLLSTKNDTDGAYNLYNNVNNIGLNIEKFGVLHSYGIDIYRTIFGFDEEIVEVNEENEEIEEVITYEKNTTQLDFNKPTSNKDITSINNYMLNESGTDKNQYTGIFSGYNLIYITAESFSEIAISEELTPTLYKLTHSGFIFDKYYTPNALSTIGGEFQSLTGLYPDNSILSKWRKGTNYFPYGLATVYKSLGYKTYAYHNNWYGFQDRHKYLKSQGFTNYIGCYNGMEKRMNCKSWPQSDLSMMKATMSDYVKNDEPFLAYYMTVSGHFQYNFSDNSMAYKNKKYVNNLKVSTAAKAYVATQIELDRALEYVLKTLEENNKLDNTVIVLLADHYPYKLSMSDVNSLSSYKRDSVVEVNHNALILWNNTISDTHITKACMSSDVLPTVYNLFGITYDSRLMTGRDILSTSPGLAIMSNRSWVSDKGTYFANSKKFAGEEVEDSYVSDMNKIVNNRLGVAKKIVKNDYYKYLLK